MKRLKKILKHHNQRGVALLLVLSSIAVLATAVVELAYKTDIDYQLAVNGKERLQAYYMAQSAFQFSKIVLLMQREGEKKAEKYKEYLKGQNIQPFYKQYPISTEALRAIFLNGGTGEGSEATKEGGDSEEEKALPVTEKPDEDADKSMLEKGMDNSLMDQNMANGFDKEKAGEFLDFDGDFSIEISEESTKFDLNRFSGLETASKNYDFKKKLLLNILKQETFKDDFKDDEERIDLVNALADWVDVNNAINEFDNVQRGNEDNLYRGVSYPVKNAKYLSLSEIRLVAGMTDSIYKKLAPLLTIYSGSDKMNVCISDTKEDDMKALITYFTSNAGCTQPMEADDVRMEALVTKILAECPDTAAMATALNQDLGLSDTSTDTGEVIEPPSETETPGEEQKPKKSTSAAGNIPGCDLQFKNLITTDNKVFTVKAHGRVGDTEVTIESVIKNDGANPYKWPMLYYRLR
ncbi:general secretion pathway protein GspK [bacterium]|nr:general secretion pathway protein GspK [bacterium]